jgi:hypothetical protein
MSKVIKPTIRIHNADTGEIVDREMTDEEFTQYEKDQAESTEEIQTQQVSKDPLIAAEQAAQKAAQKAALLVRLGLNEDEAKLLLS